MAILTGLASNAKTLGELVLTISDKSKKAQLEAVRAQIELAKAQLEAVVKERDGLVQKNEQLQAENQALAERVAHFELSSEYDIREGLLFKKGTNDGPYCQVDQYVGQMTPRALTEWLDLPTAWAGSSRVTGARLPPHGNGGVTATYPRNHWRFRPTFLSTMRRRRSSPSQLHDELSLRSKQADGTWAKHPPSDDGYVFECIGLTVGKYAKLLPSHHAHLASDKALRLLTPGRPSRLSFLRVPPMRRSNSSG